jgi:hypothetical protein
MATASIANKLGVGIRQFVLDGIYITEDYHNRIPSYSDKIKPIDKKKEFYDKAHELGGDEVKKFASKLIQNQSNN